MEAACLWHQGGGDGEPQSVRTSGRRDDRSTCALARRSSGELLSEYAVKRLDRGGHGEAWMLLVYPDRAGVGRWIRPGRWLFLLAALRAIALIVAVGFDVFVLGVAPWLAILALSSCSGP